MDFICDSEALNLNVVIVVGELSVIVEQIKSIKRFIFVKLLDDSN